MVAGAKRQTGSGIAYVLFGVFMLYLGLCALGVISSENIPKGSFMGIASIALGMFDLMIGKKKIFSWGGSCPYCGYSKVSLHTDATSVYCRSCNKKIIRRGSFFYPGE